MDKRFVEAVSLLASICYIIHADLFTSQTVPEVLRVILNLPNAHRAQGLSGRLHSLAEATDPDAPEDTGLKMAVYLNAQAGVAPWPTSLTLRVSCQFHYQSCNVL